MQNKPQMKLPGSAKPVVSLTEALEQSAHVNQLVTESAEELSSVNSVIAEELRVADPLPGVTSALKKNLKIEKKVQNASEQLAIVNLALERAVREHRMVEHQLAAAIEQKEAARDAALHDALTGLPNRALFDDRLTHAISRATRKSSALAVLFIDLDGFKTINDTYGHDTGDAVLQTTARRLKGNTRDNDTVSRYGGDEFLCLLTEIQDEKNISMIAEKIIQAITAPLNASLSDLNFNSVIGASIGISIFPKDGTTANALVKSADTAMYRSKKEKTGFSFAT